MQYCAFSDLEGNSGNVFGRCASGKPSGEYARVKSPTYSASEVKIRRIPGYVKKMARTIF